MLTLVIGFAIVSWLLIGLVIFIALRASDLAKRDPKKLFGLISSLRRGFAA